MIAVERLARAKLAGDTGITPEMDRSEFWRQRIEDVEAYFAADPELAAALDLGLALQGAKLAGVPLDARVIDALDLGLAWQEAEAALPEGARIVTTEHYEEQIAFCAVTGEARNYLTYDGTPDEVVIAYGAADTPAEALRKLVAKLPGKAEETK